MGRVQLQFTQQSFEPAAATNNQSAKLIPGGNDASNHVVPEQSVVKVTGKAGDSKLLSD